MNLPELLLIVQWWSVFLLLSAAILPLTTTIFSSFHDRGYIFSKTIALIVLSYLSLVLGTVHVLPFSQLSLFLLIVVIAGVSYGLYFYRLKKRVIPHIRDFIHDFGKVMLFQEVLFFLMILFWAWVRGFSPDIHGLEKYMDFGFMNSIARSDYFPPKDMWLTPFSINYYYFGHCERRDHKWDVKNMPVEISDDPGIHRKLMDGVKNKSGSIRIPIRIGKSSRLKCQLP